MGEEIKLRLIFANDDTSPEMITSLSTTIKDVKHNIMETWPVADIERLRLFAGGKELGGKGIDDMKSLRDAKIAVALVRTG